MKNIFLLILCLCGMTLSSQNINPSNMNHPTISRVQVSYKVVPGTGQAQPVQGGHPDLKARPDASVALKTATDAVKIFLKIINPQDSSLVYQVSYDVNSPDVTNPQGLKLLYKDAGTIHICDPEIISLAPYRYEVYTQDAQGHSSEIFSVIQ